MKENPFFYRLAEINSAARSLVVHALVDESDERERVKLHALDEHLVELGREELSVRIYCARLRPIGEDLKRRAPPGSDFERAAIEWFYQFSFLEPAQCPT